MANNWAQAGQIGICTVISLYWAKTCLERGRGIGSFNELLLTQHQLNGLMAVYRRLDNNPAAQTEGLGLRIVGADVAVNSFNTVLSNTRDTPPSICIFWNSHHTMGCRVHTRNTSRGGAVTVSREYEWFDNEDGLWLGEGATGLADLVQIANAGFVARNYQPIEGMRVVRLP